MLANICVTPVIALGKLNGIHVKSRKVDVRDGEIGEEIYTVAALVGIGVYARRRRIWWCEPSLVTQRNQMLAICLLDVRAYFGGPIRDGRSVAAIATGLVAEFPAENCGGVFVTVDYEVDISKVGGLRILVREETGFAAAVIRDVSVYAAKIIKSVEEREDDFDVERFGFGN